MIGFIIGLFIGAFIGVAVVESITVDDTTHLTFNLIGEIKLTETISRKGRCKSI